MAVQFDIADLEKRMRSGVDVLKREFTGLRTGRASASLLEPVMVNLYGQRMPLILNAWSRSPKPTSTG